MSSTLSLTGLALDSSNYSPIADASIRLKTPSGNYFAKSDANGVFIFKDIVEPADQSYPVALYANAAGGYVQDDPPLSLTWEKGKRPNSVEVLLENRGPTSNSAGTIFLVALIGLLLALGVVYFKSHSSDKDKNMLVQENPVLVQVLTDNLTQRITLDSAKVASYQPQNDSLDSVHYVNLMADYEQVEQSTDTLLKVSKIDTGYYFMIEQGLKDVHQAILNKEKTSIVNALLILRQSIKKIPSLSPSWFWQEVPGRYAEIILWTLFASLLRLIGGTSYYVSRNSFYRNSIPHKVALLFTIPLIALIISFVFSFFKIIFQVGEEQYTLDFTSPYMSVVLAFLIGLAPWKAWKVMNGLAEKLFDSINKALSLKKPPAAPAASPAADASEEAPAPDAEEEESPATPPAASDADTPATTLNDAGTTDTEA